MGLDIWARGRVAEVLIVVSTATKCLAPGKQPSPKSYQIGLAFRIGLQLDSAPISGATCQVGPVACSLGQHAGSRAVCWVGFRTTVGGMGPALQLPDQVLLHGSQPSSVRSAWPAVQPPALKHKPQCHHDWIGYST